MSGRAAGRGFFGIDDDLLLIIGVIVVIFLLFPGFGKGFY